MTARLLVLALLLAPWPATAELQLPPGFTARVYVTGEGFDTDASRGVRGIPSTSTLAFDQTGALYLARSGRRYLGGEVYDRWPLYRIPAGGARLTPDTEMRYFYGPPLLNPQVAVTRRGREILVTTFDRERRIGALYRLVDGRAELVAGGTPERGSPPVLTQPEGVAVDGSGNVCVADRAQGLVVRLDPDGRVVDPRYLVVARPRLLAVDDKDQLWVGSDGTAEAPVQQGPGEIVQVTPSGSLRRRISGTCRRRHRAESWQPSVRRRSPREANLHPHAGRQPHRVRQLHRRRCAAGPCFRSAHA